MEEEYVYQGRIAVCAPDEAGPFNQHKLSAVLIAHKGQPVITESLEWEGIQCEIIIRPIKRLGNPKIKGMRLDQVALTLGKSDQWKIEK